MPELPEVETMRRGILNGGILGSRITDVCVLPCARKPIRVRPDSSRLRRRAVDREVLAVDRIGKRVALRLDSQEALVFEPRMTGLVLLGDPPTVEHLRVRIDFSGARVPHLWYWDRRGLGSVQLLSADELLRELGAPKLGPDALLVTGPELRSQFSSSRRAIKVALLDQRSLAGIGNLYASEILHAASIHPERPCDRLTPAQWRRLHAAMHEVLNTAIRYEGSTLSDGTYRNALNNPGGYQSQHQVYDRAGQLCFRCTRGRVQRLVQAQRSTYFCPVCQRPARRRSDGP